MTELDRTLRDSASAHPQPTVVPTYEGRPLAHPDEPVFDQGLLFDLETEFSRRKVLKLMGYGGLSAGLLTLAACGPSGSTSSPSAAVTSAAATTSAPATSNPTSSAGSSATAAAADCDVIPEETGGPFPGDGSNGPNVLTSKRHRPQRTSRRASASPRARPRACRWRSG